VSIDQFLPEHHEAFVAFKPEIAERFYQAVNRLGHYLRVELHGLQNVPEGRALLVANHTFGWDIGFAAAAIWRESRRPVWMLGEHAWWRVPFVRRVAAAVGMVDGTRKNIDRLLANDELVLVLPGGLREAMKPRELRYRLLWGDRYGFARAAIRNNAPIVPVAAIGADDVFDVVGNVFRRGERWLRRIGVPVPLPSRLLRVPHLSRLTFVFGEPIQPPHSETDVRRFRREVEGALHELMERELAARAGIEI
jgi:1-acyl-sn-glycerol-3-phosphate acyltransferase